MDIAIAWDTQNGRGDWYVAGGGLAVDAGGLVSAVLVSLFSDGRAPDDVVLLDGSDDRRGVWFDTYEDSPIGSLLWLLARAKKAGNTNLLRQAEDYCKAALQWLLTDGVAAAVAASARWITRTAMGIKIVITKPSGASDTFDFSWAWNGIG